MKKTDLAWLLAASLLATQIPSLTFDIKPAAAQTRTTFECISTDVNQGYYATIAKVIRADGAVVQITEPLINWKKWDFAESGYTPETRCQKVSNELTRVVTRYGGKLKNVWLTSGRSRNGYAVICYVEKKLGSCTQDSILLTLSRENARDPNEALRRLLNFSVYGSGLPIEETGGAEYVNLGDLVEAASRNSKTTPENPATNPTGDSPSPSSSPESPQVPSGNGQGPI